LDKLICANLKVSYLVIFPESSVIIGGGTTLNCLLVLKEGLNRKTSIEKIHSIFPEFGGIQLEIQGLKAPKHWLYYINKTTYSSNPLVYGDISDTF